jgi:hypothetical protein
MSRLYLRCALCNRQQAAGLLSGAAWRVLELPAGSNVQHAAVHEGVVRACPSCASHADWEHQVLVMLGLAPDAGYSIRVDAAG